MPAPDARPCPTEYVALAQRMADASGAIIRPYFRSGLAVEEKADLSPVTAADRESEAVMRTLIEAACPGHGVIGEEYGTERADAEFVWVLDPIDGTKSFITGVPMFGTLIALMRAGAPILGVIDQPILGERWIGATGHGTRFNGTPVRSRGCAALGDAVLFTTSPELYDQASMAAFERLRAGVKFACYGIDCYAAGLIASGHADLLSECGLETYDYCALIAVVSEAGGVITDWQGAPLDLDSDGRLIAAGDARAHAQALERLQSAD